jgi:hypothetical protein
MSNSDHSRSTRFEENIEMDSTKNRDLKYSKQSGKKNSRKQKGNLSRSASEASVDSTQIADIPADKAVPKARLLRALTQNLNWYKMSMGGFFIGLAALLVFIRVILWCAQADNQDTAEIDFSKRKYSGYEGNIFLGWIISQFYYQANGFFMGLFDILLIALTMKLVLDEEQKEVVTLNHQIIQENLKRFGPARLRDPANEGRKQIEKAQNVINKIVGSRRFKIRIMRIEAIKEVFSLDLVHHVFFHLFRLTVKISSPLPENYTPQLDLFFEGTLLCFLHFKNMVYFGHRIGQRPELSTHRHVAVFVSLTLFLLRIVSLLQFYMMSRNLWLGLTMTAVSYGGYRLADYINDRHRFNSLRNQIFLNTGLYN